ncbi:hypothetical protein ACSGO4_001180 [Candidatus Pelagibacter ubique HIMB4]|jgi:hypothetical protein
MMKFLIFGLMLSLIISTSLIKNSTRDLDEQIYSIQENLLFLEERFKDSKLEFNYLSSSEKLLEYQRLYFENALIKKTLADLKILKVTDNGIITDDLKILGKK